MGWETATLVVATLCTGSGDRSRSLSKSWSLEVMNCQAPTGTRRQGREHTPDSKSWMLGSTGRAFWEFASDIFEGGRRARRPRESRKRDRRRTGFSATRGEGYIRARGRSATSRRTIIVDPQRALGVPRNHGGWRSRLPYRAAAPGKAAGEDA